jgi:isopentenyl diphosphate isomerase/L-lactate dehydrogenase-like FMN-dependent dehydrogenase
MVLKEWKDVQIVSHVLLQETISESNNIAVLAEEVEITMKMLGVSSLDQLRPEMINTSRLENEMWRPAFGRSKL